MSAGGRRRQSVYLPDVMLQEIQIAADAHDASLSEMIQRAWRIARTEIRKYPSANPQDPEYHERPGD